MLAPNHGADLTGAEVVAVSALSAAAAAILTAYLIYRAGLTIAPFMVLLASLTAPTACLVWLRPRATWNAAELIAAGAILTGVVGWLLWLARPDLLPMGSGPDLTHHMVLIDYIAHHWQLVDDPNLVSYLGEMVHYTPGSHLLIALASAWTRADVLHVVHPVLALTVGIKSVLVFLVALRLLPRDVPRVPLAVTAVLLLFLPLQYFVGSFTHDSFWAQVVAEVFACGMWWALVVWDARPTHEAMVLIAVAGAATFIIWPMWIGPLTVALLALIVLRDGLSLRERLTHLTIGFGPLAGIAAIHTAGRLGWVGIAATSGAVTQPSASAFGWTFLVLSAIGLFLAGTRREGRATALLIGAIAAQAVALFVLAKARGADTPYMVYKMMYLIIYPLAAVAAVAIAEVWRIVSRRVSGLGTPPTGPAWALAALISVFIGRHVIEEPRPRPVVSQSVYLAGLWARTHVEPACVDYLVADGNTAYWLHLAVLGNPRVTVRVADRDTFEPKRALIRWIYPDGLPFAVADDFNALPKDIRNSVDVLVRFGRSAVIKRPRPSRCP